jgi:PKD repeat protein
MNILTKLVNYNGWPKETYIDQTTSNALVDNFIKEPINNIRENSEQLQKRKLIYNHTEKIWTHNGYDKSEDYSREMDLYHDEFGNRRYCLNQDPEKQHFIYLVCNDILPLSPIIKQTVPTVRRSWKDTLSQTLFHDSRCETRYFSLHVPFDYRPENKNEYDYAFDCGLMSDLVNMASDMEYGSWSNNRRFQSKKQDWNQKKMVSKHVFYDFWACWIYDQPTQKQYTNQFISYLSSARTGYTFSYDKEKISLFIDRLRELYTIIASEKKLHQIHDAVIQSNYVTYIDCNSYNKPKERWTFSRDEQIQYIAQNTQLTLLSRITAMMHVTEELLQTL